jgi:hypothetical protein
MYLTYRSRGTRQKTAAPLSSALGSYMIEDNYPPDPPLRAEERARVAELSTAQIQAIDDALMANVSIRWRKVARVVMSAMDALKQEGNLLTGIPDIFYAERVRELMNRGQIEGDGDFSRMGRSEVRLPPTVEAKE